MVLPQYAQRTIAVLIASASSGAAHVEQLNSFGMNDPLFRYEIVGRRDYTLYRNRFIFHFPFVFIIRRFLAKNAV
jgi:hypothetical protein